MSIPQVAAHAYAAVPNLADASNDELARLFHRDGPIGADLPLAMQYLDQFAAEAERSPMQIKRCLHRRPEVLAQVSRVFTDALWLAVAPQYPRMEMAFLHCEHVIGIARTSGPLLIPTVTIDELESRLPLGMAALKRQIDDDLPELTLPPHSEEGKQYRRLFTADARPVLEAHFGVVLTFYNCCNGAAEQPPPSGKIKPSLAKQLMMQITPDC
jgi:hypothetical protein